MKKCAPTILSPWIKKGVILLLFFAAHPSFAALLHDPELNWQTLHTPHFAIHFHDGEQTMAKALVPIAEGIHQRLSKELNWTPSDKTDVVLTDRMDFSNGWATPYPRNHITLITTPPADLITLEDHKGWLKLVFLHEYVHILHLDMARRLPSNLRIVLGRFPLLFPNLFQPSWLKEGLATYVETDKEQGVGRGQSTLYRAMMRLEWQNGLKPLAQANAYTTEWPMGTVYYLYGVYFYQFLQENYGQEKIDELIARFSENLIPFMINTNSRQVLRKKYPELWQEFEAYLAKQFGDEVAAIEAQGVIAGEQLSHSGYQSGYPQRMANGDLYYIEDTPYDRARLMLRRHGEKQGDVVAEVRGNYFDAHAESGILLVQTELFNNTNYFNDLYLIDPTSGKETRLTEGGRYRYAVWSNNGQQIYALHYQLGQHSLQLLDTQGQLIDTLWQGEDGTVIGPFKLAPNGNTLIASLWYPEGQWDLAEFDLTTRQWQRLTHSEEIEAQPRYTDDGSQIIFTAEYDGNYNIHRLSKKSLQTEQLTRVMGGAFYPTLSPDQQTLYYSGLTSRGYDLFSLPLSHTESAKPLPVTEMSPVATSAAEHYPTTQSNYDPVQRLLPSWWYPHLLLTEERSEFGFLTAGNDPLWQHFYQALLIHDTKNNWQLGNIWYRYDRWSTSFQIFGERLKQFTLGPNNKVLRVRNEDSLTLAMERPFMKMERQWALHAGIIHERTSDALVNAPYLPRPDFKNTFAGLAISFNDSNYYPRSISPMDGRTINLVFEDYDLANGYYEGDSLKLDWREYLRLGQQQLLALRATIGWSDNLAHPFRLGGSASDLITRSGNPSSPLPFNNYDYALRGYQEGLPQLRGQHMVLTDIEWRFPIKRIERTLMAPPIGIQKIHGKLFYSEAAVWNVGNHPDNSYKSGGAEITTEIVAGYMLPLDLRIGFAKGMDKIGEKQFYLQLGASF